MGKNAAVTTKYVRLSSCLFALLREKFNFAQKSSVAVSEEEWFSALRHLSVAEQ